MATDTLDGMTWDEWKRLPEHRKAALRAPAYPAQMAPYLGMRVEVTTHYGETRRFWVGRSTGWRPCFLEVKTRRSMGGDACDRDGYTSVRIVDRGPR